MGKEPVPHNPSLCHVENRLAILESPLFREGHQVLLPLWPLDPLPL